MIRVRHNRYHFRIKENLHTRCTSPYRILKVIGSNAYELDILRDLSISIVIDDEDLTRYYALLNFPATILNPLCITVANAHRLPVLLPPP